MHTVTVLQSCCFAWLVVVLTKQSNNIWFECCLFCLTFQQQGERLILCVDATCGYGNWQQHEDLGTVQLLYLSCTKINVYYNDKTCNMITKWYDITAGYETEQNLHRWALRFVPWIFFIFFICACVFPLTHMSLRWWMFVCPSMRPSVAVHLTLAFSQTVL